MHFNRYLEHFHTNKFELLSKVLVIETLLTLLDDFEVINGNFNK